VYFSIVKETEFHVSMGKSQVLDGPEEYRLKSLI
jgi:hypothetical protein